MNLDHLHDFLEMILFLQMWTIQHSSCQAQPSCCFFFSKLFKKVFFRRQRKWRRLLSHSVDLEGEKTDGTFDWRELTTGKGRVDRFLQNFPFSLRISIRQELLLQDVRFNGDLNKCVSCKNRTSICKSLKLIWRAYEVCPKMFLLFTSVIFWRKVSLSAKFTFTKTISFHTWSTFFYKIMNIFQTYIAFASISNTLFDCRMTKIIQFFNFGGQKTKIFNF